MIDNHIIAAHMIRKYGNVISDEHMKVIYSSVEDPKMLAAAIHALGAPFNDTEAAVLSYILGGRPEGDDLEDEIFNKYAEHVHNYLYTYKDEAKAVDPSIDTSVKHTGPMAQDLEKVNPAVVNTDPETGVKTVDVDRLSLMNAGVIADLARRVQELENGR